VKAVMSSQPLLSLEHLSAHYVSQQGARVVRAVDDVTLSLNAGGTLGIVGESGRARARLRSPSCACCRRRRASSAGG
jgi:ABC-type oligopeptide transport system, ATPase component